MRFRAFSLAIAVGALGAGLLWFYLRAFEAEATGGPLVGVLVSLRTIEPGSPLRPADVGERFVPQAYVETRAIRAAQRDKIMNLPVSVLLESQQTIMWTDVVVPSDDKGNLSALVQPGMRAITIHAEGKTSTLVRPGDRVDLIVTYAGKNGNDPRQGVVLLQNVLVLGRGADAPEGRQSAGADLALSVSLADAQHIDVAAESGRLSVALRSPDDVRLLDVPAEIPRPPPPASAKPPTAHAKVF